MLEGTTTTCTVIADGLPYSASVEHTSGENTTLTATPGTGGGNQRAHVKYGSLINCTFGKGSVVLAGTNGSPTKFVPNTELNCESGICPSPSTWQATYKDTSPAGGDKSTVPPPFVGLCKARSAGSLARPTITRQKWGPASRAPL
jgi:hypothetical protein